MEKELLRGKEARKVTITGFWINAVLSVGKILAGIIGKSGAMIADGIHSLSDFLTDIVVLAGFRFTEQPEDDCHNYGHDKYETLATVIISIVLGIVGFGILKSGINNITLVMNGVALPRPGVIALVAAGASIIAKELLYRYTLAVGNRINSSAVMANAWHHRSDAFSSIGTLIGIAGAITLGDKWTVLDPIASVIVSLFIFKVALEILIPALKELMESSLSGEERKCIEDILENSQNVKGYHKLRTRRLGTKAVIDAHILVEEVLNIKDAHTIASGVEAELKEALGSSCIITIHVEPYEEDYNESKVKEVVTGVSDEK